MASPFSVKLTNMITLDTPSLTTLGAEPVPTEIVRDLLLQAWIPTQRVPRPEIHLMNDLTMPGEQTHLKRNDYILIAEPGIQESQHGHSYEYKDIDVTVPMEIYTILDRQRLYDIYRACARIIYTYQHVIRPYQQLHVDTFQEAVRDKHGVWAGTFTIRLESKAVPIITGIATGFETPSQPQAGANAAEFPPTPATSVEEPEAPPLPPYNPSNATF
jgi:hypothetical protein